MELRLQLQEALICKLGEVGVPRKMRRKLVLWFTTQPLHLLIKGYLGAMEETRERHVLPGSFKEECSSLSLHYTCVLEKEAENTQIPSESSTENRDRHDETPQEAPSLSCQNASFSGHDSESEKQPLQDDQAWSGPSSEVLDDVSDDLEARRLIFVLDGPEYLDDAFLASEDGQRLYRGYLAKVKQRRPEIVRISVINALLQKDWPVWKGNKRDARLEKVGAWFHSSYDRYVDQTRPLKPTGEIAHELRNEPVEGLIAG
ncbi:hypothetical protein KSD_74670 [Ktedonobacter sp. SOSP1-85]|uniref:hypothetical protein n=1 Tax=Ktedonobacter sp. SOSP1-85 TaxID=2778367 RepID=UPI001914E40B|nr:hypothetical protein [Ktedonobacter sp. SOSP1-85]GHO79696.1 hypothetical protein KSD_74670 [Ktedonobacter sp. SOSP1-85]